MALKQTHHLRQAQSLVMTPKLQQSIQLLEMTNHQLNAFIKDEIEKNPFLDEVINTETAETEGYENSNDLRKELNPTLEKSEFSEQKVKSVSSNKSSWEPKTFETNSRDTQFKKTEENNEINSITDRLAQGNSLQEHLLMQFNLERHTNDEAMIAARL
jgi:RNA polymerase sigma-54 factor